MISEAILIIHSNPPFRLLNPTFKIVSAAKHPIDAGKKPKPQTYKSYYLKVIETGPDKQLEYKFKLSKLVNEPIPEEIAPKNSK